jgi:hypothetical protein
MLDFRVLAVGHLRKEDCVLALGIEVFLVIRVLEIILARAWVCFAREVVLSHNVRFK